MAIRPSISSPPQRTADNHGKENDANHFHQSDQQQQQRQRSVVFVKPTNVSDTNERVREGEDETGDDRTPLLKSELQPPARSDSSQFNATSPVPTRQHSLHALFPPPPASTTPTTDLKSRRRVSLSSALRRSSFAKHCSTSDRVDSCRSSSPSVSSSSSSSSSSAVRKEFMHKIDRFRFIDDSASSTTTTADVEARPAAPTTTPSHHLISNAIEQFEDYLRTTYPPSSSDEMNSLIDRLDSDLLLNGSYSDLNILNRRPPTTSPMPTLPHSRTTPLQIDVISSQSHSHGYSRSMDFVRSNAWIPALGETSSSSSTATLTSLRSSTSLEFDDHSKPSGVLVDDDFLPMSSPVDDFFWDFSEKAPAQRDNCYFPNVGSSPDLEVKRFDLQLIQNLSETSCDEDDEDEVPPSRAAATSASDDNDFSEGEESADNGEIDLVQEFEDSRKDSSPPAPQSIMKMSTNKSVDNLQEATPSNALKPKVRFNLDPAYEREREWNKVNKLLGNSVEWTDEFEV